MPDFEKMLKARGVFVTGPDPELEKELAGESKMTRAEMARRMAPYETQLRTESVVLPRAITPAELRRIKDMREQRENYLADPSIERGEIAKVQAEVDRLAGDRKAKNTLNPLMLYAIAGVIAVVLTLVAVSTVRGNAAQ